MGRQEALYWLVVAYGAFLALLFVRLPFLVIALVLRSSGRPASRRLSHVLLAVDAVAVAVTVGAASMPLLGKLRLAYRTSQRTYSLSQPRVLAGVLFPAGSTVRLNEDGTIERGTVPVPTVVAGLPLIGEFGTGDWLQAFQGILAVPVEVEGVPCAAGPVWSLQGASISCILGRGYAYAGHELAPGQPVTVNILTTGERRLVGGTLLRPELLFDVPWPAGTVFGSTAAAATPEQLAHGPVPPADQIDLCLMSGQTVSIPGATLHGTITYSVKRGQSRVWSGCHLQVAGPMITPSYPDDGYAEVGPDHYLGGSRGTGPAWRWDNNCTSDDTR